MHSTNKETTTCYLTPSHLLLFLRLFFALYWLSARWLRVQNTLILLGSYLFYGWWDERFLILLIVSTVTDYLGGMGAAGRPFKPGMVRNALIFAWVASAAVLMPTIHASAWILGWLAGFSAMVVLGIHLSRDLSDDERRKAFVAGSIAINLSVLGFFKYFNFFAAEFAERVHSLGFSVSPLVIDVILPVGISSIRSRP